MSTEVCLYCDFCGGIIAGGRSTKHVRSDAKTLFRRIKGRDVCTTCLPLHSNYMKSLHKAAAISDDPSADPVQHPWGGAF